MAKDALEKAIERGVDFLTDILPADKQLYFPLIYSVIIWAVRRPRIWRERIFSWEIWPDPGYLKIKSDEYILFFFTDHEELRKHFHPEIQKEDLPSLRSAFRCLYPLLGLKDPFLTALFKTELEAGEYRKIIDDFAARTAAAREAVAAAGGRPRFLEGLLSLGREAAALAGYLAGKDDIQDLVLEKIRKAGKE